MILILTVEALGKTSVIILMSITCWKQPKCPWVREWLNKLWWVHAMEFCTAVKRNEDDLYKVYGVISRVHCYTGQRVTIVCCPSYKKDG